MIAVLSLARVGRDGSVGLDDPRAQACTVTFRILQPRMRAHSCRSSFIVSYHNAGTRHSAALPPGVTTHGTSEKQHESK